MSETIIATSTSNAPSCFRHGWLSAWMEGENWVEERKERKMGCERIRWRESRGDRIEIVRGGENSRMCL